MSASDSADDLLADWLNRRDGVPEPEPLPLTGPVKYWHADEPRPIAVRRRQRVAALGIYWDGAWREAFDLADQVPGTAWTVPEDPRWTTRIDVGERPGDGITITRDRRVDW